ncbi:MAG TPA: phosphodiester glycosidase family protein [Bacteroidales bacterium]|nr:phosphodiester glycosidase family protein [Bacteroidales bacterium]
MPILTKYNFLKKNILCFLVLIIFFSGKNPGNHLTQGDIEWNQLDDGLFYTEITGPHISKFSDSKVSILKIDPDFFNFELVASSESDSTLRTIRDWCELKSLTGGINAGMYSLKDHLSGVGLMQNFEHINNPVVKENFNALVVFNPKNKSLPPLQIVDMVNQDWKSILKDYQSCFQSIRMIDNDGKAVYWEKKPELKCSMSVLAMDKPGNILFLFARSPYSANEFIDFMLKGGLQIQTAMYLEGGPEATIYVKTTKTEIEKFGSYVSYSKPDDSNSEVRKMPNVLGIRKK